MATFASKTFNAAAYLKCRPTYPVALLQDAVKFAGLSTKDDKLALDIGCGTGQSTNALLSTNAFSRIIAIDPSAKMIDSAKSYLTDKRVECRVGNAETILDHVEPGSVNLITSGQAAHWFKHDESYPVFAKALKPGGALAFFTYGIVYTPQFPQLPPLFREFFINTLKGYWETGRSFVDNQYDDLPLPDLNAKDSPWREIQRHKYHSQEHDAPNGPEIETDRRHPGIIEKDWTAEDLTKYLDTLSAVHTYKERHTSENISKTFVDSLIKKGLPATDIFKTQWPCTLIVIKRKQ